MAKLLLSQNLVHILLLSPELLSQEAVPCIKEGKMRQMAIKQLIPICKKLVREMEIVL